MKVYVLFFFLLLCFNLSHSQISFPGPSSPAPPPVVYPPLPSDPVAPILNSTQQIINGVPAAPPSTNPATPVPVAPVVPTPRYEEYQSICRSNEYDIVYFLPDSTKEKRVQLLEEKIKKDPGATKLQLRLLKEYVDQRKIKESEDLLQRLKASKISENEIKTAAAAVFYLKKERKKAKTLLNEILTEQPKNQEALIWLAEMYKSENNYFESSSIYYDLIKDSKVSVEEDLCEVTTLDARYADAEPICLKGLANKNSPYFDIYLGIAAREQQKLKEAANYFSSSLKIKETEMAETCTAEIFYMQKKWSAAEERFQKALKISPKSIRAMTGLAWSYFKDKNRDKALEYFKEACRLDKKQGLEIRKAVKFLIDEKSDLSSKYLDQLQRCSSI